MRRHGTTTDFGASVRQALFGWTASSGVEHKRGDVAMHTYLNYSMFNSGNIAS